MVVVKFSDFSGEACEVRVGTGSSSTPVYGAPDAFSVEEDSNDDIATPVRTQSGNINIVDVEDDWTALIPTDGGVMPVYLYEQNALLWAGYVNPGTYGSPYLGVAPSVSIPVVCPLTMLGAVDFAPTTAMQTILQFLTDIFQDGDHQTIQMPFSVTSQDAGAITSLYLTGRAFYDIDEEGNLIPKYSCLEALRLLCTVCGLTARWTGTQVLLEGLPQAPVGSDPIPDIADYAFADANQEQRYIAGWRKVTVTPNEDEMKPVFEIPDSIIKNRVLANAGNITFNDFDQYKSDPNQGMYVWIAGEYGGEGTQIALSTPIMNVTAANIRYSNYGSSVEVYDYYKTDNLADPSSGKQSFQWVTVLRLFGTAAGVQSEPCITVSILPTLTFSEGFFVFSGGIVEAYERSQSSGYIVCTLKVGDEYWNGQSWLNVKQPFHLLFEDGQIKNNRELSSYWGDYDGFGIYVGGQMAGQVEFQVHGVYIQRTQAPNDIIGVTNLKLEFVRREDYTVNGERKYTATNSSKYIDTKDISTAFVSDNETKSLQNVMTDQQGKPVREITIGQYVGRPEQWIADKLAAFGAHSRHALKLNVRGHLDNVSDYEVNGENYHCFATSHNYAENSTTLNLIEI